MAELLMIFGVLLVIAGIALGLDGLHRYGVWSGGAAYIFYLSIIMTGLVCFFIGLTTISKNPRDDHNNNNNLGDSGYCSGRLRDEGCWFFSTEG